MKKVSQQQIDSILSLLDQGVSSNRKTASITGLHHSTVGRVRSQHCSSLPKSIGGRPAKLSAAAKCYAIYLIGSGEADTAVEVHRTLQSTLEEPVSTQTVCQGLKESGLMAATKKKAPLLSPHHKKAQMDFAIAHQDWTVDDWSRVVWSDETKINRLGSDGRKWVWKKKGERLSDRLVQGTQKFGGGSVMVWGCMGWDGAGYACKIDGRMDADLYCSILEDELLSSLEFWRKTTEDIIFQRDNDPKHTSKKAKSWFDDHDFDIMVWPANSPDFNPIEHLWDPVKRKLAGYEHPPSGTLELWERVQKEWDEIPKSVCQDLISSMPRRVEEVLKSKGGNTRY